MTTRVKITSLMKTSNSNTADAFGHCGTFPSPFLMESSAVVQLRRSGALSCTASPFSQAGTDQKCEGCPEAELVWWWEGPMEALQPLVFWEDDLGHVFSTVLQSPGQPSLSRTQEWPWPRTSFCLFLLPISCPSCSHTPISQDHLPN